MPSGELQCVNAHGCLFISSRWFGHSVKLPFSWNTTSCTHLGMPEALECCSCGALRSPHCRTQQAARHVYYVVRQSIVFSSHSEILQSVERRKGHFSGVSGCSLYHVLRISTALQKIVSFKSTGPLAIHGVYTSRGVLAHGARN